MWKYLSGCSQPRWSQINMSFLISLILINAWHMHSFAKNVISQAEASRAPAVPLPVIRDPPLLRVKRCLLTLASVSCGSQHSSLLTLCSKDRFKIHLTAVTSPLPLSCPPLSCSWTLYTNDRGTGQSVTCFSYVSPEHHIQGSSSSYLSGKCVNISIH